MNENEASRKIVIFFLTLLTTVGLILNNSRPTRNWSDLEPSAGTESGMVSVLDWLAAPDELPVRSLDPSQDRAELQTGVFIYWRRPKPKLSLGAVNKRD